MPPLSIRRSLPLPPLPASTGVVNSLRLNGAVESLAEMERRVTSGSRGPRFLQTVRRDGFTRAMFVVVVSGTIVRLVVSHFIQGNSFDMTSYGMATDALRHTGLHAYEALARVQNPNEYPRWPYPPGFFPWLLAVRVMRHVIPVSFGVLIKLPMIFSDAALSIVVSLFVRRRTGRDRSAVAAGALVAFGPLFIIISAAHGQLDSLAILPAALAVYTWEFHRNRSPVVAGLLIGAGALLKTVPAALLLVLLPHTRSRREGVQLVASAAIPLAVCILPFVLAAPAPTMHALNANKGIPGIGGLSLIVQPSVAGWWIKRGSAPSALTLDLLHVQSLIALAVLAIVGLVLVRRRPPPEFGATLLWLGFYVFVPNIALQYLMWGLPFFLMARRTTAVFLLQAVIVLPAVLLYTGSSAVWLYVVLMIGVWAFFLLWLIAEGRAIWLRRTDDAGVA